MNKREIGFYCESAAVSYLKNKGFEIIEKNFRYGRFAEIDIIALKNSVLHIIEVKARSNKHFGRPAEAVNYKK